MLIFFLQHTAGQVIPMGTANLIKSFHTTDKGIESGFPILEIQDGALHSILIAHLVLF